MLRTILAFLFLFILGGCARIQTTSTVYHTSDFSFQGKTYTFYALPGQNNLQYDHVMSLVDVQLQKYGLIKNNQVSDYTIAVAYGISSPQANVINMPIYGQTGISNSYTTDSYNVAGNSVYGSSNTTYTPSYGIVGMMPTTVVKYVRYFSLRIFQTGGFSPKESKPIYSIDVQSLGSTSNLEMTLPALISGGFNNFPGSSGQVYNEVVNVDSKTGLPFMG